jgi:hypothetical protein
MHLLERSSEGKESFVMKYQPILGLTRLTRIENEESLAMAKNVSDDVSSQDQFGRYDTVEKDEKKMEIMGSAVFTQKNRAP